MLFIDCIFTGHQKLSSVSISIFTLSFRIKKFTYLRYWFLSCIFRFSSLQIISHHLLSLTYFPSHSFTSCWHSFSPLHTSSVCHLPISSLIYHITYSLIFFHLTTILLIHSLVADLFISSFTYLFTYLLICRLPILTLSSPSNLSAECLEIVCNLLFLSSQSYVMDVIQQGK